MLLGAEIAMMVLGVVALIAGKLTLTTTRIVRGGAARALGIFALVPVPLSFGLGMLIGASAPEGVVLDSQALYWPMTGLEAGVTIFGCAFIYAVGWPLAGPVGPRKGKETGDPDFGRDAAEGPEWGGAEPEVAEGTPGISLMLGLLSLGLLFVTGIPAILLGVRSLRAIRRGRAHSEGEWAAAAGLACGGIGTIVGVGLILTTPILLKLWSTNPPVAAAPRGFQPVRAARPAPPVVNAGAPARIAPTPPIPPRDRRPQRVHRIGHAESSGLRAVTTLDRFVASVVDPASKTALIADSGGLIQILAYPEFEPLGSFQLDGKAFRLALDAPRGLLYAMILRDRRRSRRGSPRELSPHLDYGALDYGSGDLHVYDVKAILGEGHPLPPGAMRPLAVIPIADPVNRFELAPDGRHLYWFQGYTDNRFTRPDSSKVVEFDAESRKLARTVDLPDGTMAFCLSRDGKTAYAGGSPPGRRTDASYMPGWIVEVDLATMTARPPLTIAADPYDIAATDDGRVYLSGQNATSRQLVAVVEIRKARSVVAAWPGGTGHEFIHLSPDGSRVYLQTIGQSPAELTLWDLPSNPDDLPVERARVAQGLSRVSIGGDFFITPDGRFLLSGLGTVFQLSTDK